MLSIRALAQSAAAACLLLIAGCTKGSTPDETPAPEKSSPSTEAEKGEGGFELPPGTGPVATVDGKPIPREAFNQAFIEVLQRYERGNHEVKPALLERLKDNIVRRLVDQAIIDRQAEKMGVKLDPEEMAKKWAEHKKRYGSDEAFRAFLERAGTTSETVRANFEDNHLREAVFARVGQDVTISGDEIRTFYEENRERYDEPEMIRANHILIRVPPGASEEVVKEKRELAEKVRKEARRKDADFVSLARQYGEDPTKDRGGDLGFFPRGRMVKPFEQAAWKLKKGQISKVVRTQFGFHIIKKTDHREASRKKLEEVSEQIERGLLARKRNAAIREALEKWKEEANIEIFVKGDPEIINATYDRPPGGPSPLAPAEAKGRPQLKMPPAPVDRGEEGPAKE